ncbi:MAG: helix-turn-helix domain-containing protein [Acidobacteriota bacterium]|nr:helix-turn-helix domain-containing protein [Acidobacteriota bacterium]
MRRNKESQAAIRTTPVTAVGPGTQPYLVGPILRACQVLKAFHFEGESIPLRELVGRTRLNKTTVFRAAQSLVAGGLLERVGGDNYRSLVTASGCRKFRIGYAGMTAKSLFARDVTDSIRVAAAAKEIELVELDNRLSAKVAIRNSQRLVRDRVDLAIEFQVHQDVAPIVASNFEGAGIPMVAIHTPHPGAIFFGGNNYVAGRIAGRALGRWALQVWAGKVDTVLLLGHSAAGALTQSRLTGTVVGITDVLSHIDSSAAVSLDVKGGYVETHRSAFEIPGAFAFSKVSRGLYQRLGGVRSVARLCRKR